MADQIKMYSRELRKVCKRCGKKLRDHQILFLESGAVGLGHDTGPHEGRICVTNKVCPVSDSVKVNWIAGD